MALLDPLLPEEDLLSAIRRTDLEMLVIDGTLPELWRLIQERMPQIVLSEFWQERECSGVCENTQGWKVICTQFSGHRYLN